MKTSHFTLTIFLFLALSVCLPPTAMSAEGVRPGATNPVTTSRQTLFRDDEVFLLRVSPNDYELDNMYAVPENNDLTNWTKYNELWTTAYNVLNAFKPYDNRPIASARGRTTDHGHDYAVYAFFQPDGDVMVIQYDPKARVDDGHGMAGDNSFTGSTRSIGRSLDIALGDLDGLPGNDAWYHDEIVLVRTNDDGDVDVDVIDHQDFTSLAHDTIPYDGVGGAMRVSVDIGDLNGDGVLEIVVGMLSGSFNDYQIVVYTYSRGGVFQLFRASTYNREPVEGDDFDLTVGDFNGDGQDEVIVAAGVGGYQIDLLQSDEDLNLHRVDHMITMQEGARNTLRVVSGLFIYDPAHGWTLSRRQAAVCSEGYDSIKCNFLKVHTDQSLLLYDTAEISPPDGWSFRVNDQGFTSMDITTGNFVGHGVDEKETSPLMDLAVSYVEYNDWPTKLRPGMKILSNVSDKFEEEWSWTGAERDYDSETRGNWQMATTVTAADGDGDTYRLGVPAHIVIDNVVHLDRVIQEPPKHVDYLPDQYGKWGIINVSGYSEFAVTLTDHSTFSLNTETTSTSSWDIGGGLEADAKSTVTAGDMKIDGVQVSAEIDLKLGYDYQENESTYNSHYQSHKYSDETTTSIDDIVRITVRTFDVWRYPIVGYYDADSENHYGYQEIVMPSNNYTVYNGVGKAFAEWYQPFHENHNLLSYPLLLQYTDWQPDDLGSFNISGEPDQTVIMNDDSQIYSWSGKSVSFEEVDWTNAAGSGNEKYYNHTLSESAELTIGYKAKASVGIDSAKEQFTGKVSFYNSNSWGGATVSKAINSQSTGLQLTYDTKDVVPVNQIYDFQLAAYITNTGGAFKVAYAVGPVSSDKWTDWWKNHYGSQPDPALNLPNRLTWHNADQAHKASEWWTLTTGPSRHEMRGFLLREFVPEGGSTEDSDTQKPPQISRIILDGDIVNLCARVYNYSLSKSTGDFDVRFYYYPWEPSNGKLLPNTWPVSQLQMVATANLASLDDTTDGATSREEVCVEWDTTGLSDFEGYYYCDPLDPSNCYYVNTFRFLVILDWDDDVYDEIHELFDAAGNEVLGSNNIGTWPWKGYVTVSNNPDPSQTVGDLNQNDLSIAAGSMAVKTGQGIVRTDDKGGPLHLELGKTYEIRALVQADQDHPFHRLLFLYDGDPDGKDKGKMKGHPAGKGKGNPDGRGKVIDSTKVHGIEAESQYVWVRWTPDTLGKQEIWMSLLEDSDEVNPGNAIDSLKVIVVPAKKSKSHPKKSK